jgi:hypothetical protein
VDEMRAETFEDAFIRRIEQADEAVAMDGRAESIARSVKSEA